MLRGLNIIAVGGLIAAAAVVYDVKYSATYEAQKVARLNNEIAKEREKIATLKAEWSTLSSPDRIQRLASKYLGMKAMAVTQIGNFSSLPDRLYTSADPIGDIINSLDHNGGARDPIGTIIEKMESAEQAAPDAAAPNKSAAAGANDEPETTGSIGETELPEPTGTIGGTTGDTIGDAPDAVAEPGAEPDGEQPGGGQ
jgi:cell division protein FtsL